MLYLFSGVCPDSHPYPFLGGDYCCESSKEKNDPSQDGALCDGSEIRFDSKCCEGNQYTQCPDPPCQPVHGRQGILFYIGTVMRVNISGGKEYVMKI